LRLITSSRNCGRRDRRWHREHYASSASDERFYVRGHGAVPELPDDASLRVEGLVDEPLELSLKELRDDRFAPVEVTATLQCAGNRRVELATVREIPGEASWGSGAIRHGGLGGVRLADVIAAAGPRSGARHVAFVGAERADEAKPPQRFGGSVPLEKALRPEVLLAWEMNGEPLPLVHGGPGSSRAPRFCGSRG
jgi:sulfite oxidase